jgi:hypothetical protein
MHRIFIGGDSRQVVSLTTLIWSITKNAKTPIAITPLVLETLPIKRAGLTPFTWSRFLVPYLCNYEGWGLFLDADMICNGDISEVFKCGDASKAVHVMKDQPAFEWASAILFNCAHPDNKVLTPEHIDDPKTNNLHKIGWLPMDQIGNLPREWNVCVPYTANPPENPKLVHFTQGVPHWWETRNQPHADKWVEYAREAIGATVSWWELMGRSVHRDSVVNRLIVTGEVKDEEDYCRKAGLVLGGTP